MHLLVRSHAHEIMLLLFEWNGEHKDVIQQLAKQALTKPFDHKYWATRYYLDCDAFMLFHKPVPHILVYEPAADPRQPWKFMNAALTYIKQTFTTNDDFKTWLLQKDDQDTNFIDFATDGNSKWALRCAYTELAKMLHKYSIHKEIARLW